MYPVVLDINSKLCVVIGGGKVACRKVAGLLSANALVRVISPEVVPELAELARTGKIEWREKQFAAGDLHDALLVFAATDDRSTQKQVCRQAEKEGQLVNVVDDPGCCNFQVPASCRRGDLTLAVSTNGKSPAVAAMIREEFDNLFGPEYEVLLDIMAQVRRQLSDGNNTQAQRKKIYKKILHDDIVEWIRAGQTGRVSAHLENILGSDIELDICKLKPGVS